jgi:methylase of polypeptide subunit release factors
MTYPIDVLNRQELMIEAMRSLSVEGRIIRHLGISLVVQQNVFLPCDDSIPMLMMIDKLSGKSVLDMGTGCGLISIAAAKNGAGKVLAVDWNKDALANAQRNVGLNALEALIEIRYSDVFDQLQPNETFDLVYANLPFMNCEAHDVVESAIWDSNLYANRKYLDEVCERLNPGGQAFLTQSSFGALDDILNMANHFNLDMIQMASKRSYSGDIFYVFEIIRKDHQ